MKYSSRYDAVLAGRNQISFLHIFLAELLADLCVSSICGGCLVWQTARCHYFARKLPTGVDGIGTVLRYADFDVTIQTGKNR